MRCPKNVKIKKAIKKSISDQLKDLVKDYLNTVNSDSKGRLGTSKELHELYLTDLSGVYDFICGEEGNNGSQPYILNNHQWHFKLRHYRKAVKAMAEALKGIENIEFDSFENLVKYIDDKKDNTPDSFGFGHTCIYDFALRWGWNHKPRIAPSQNVWLHTKPLESARKLRKMGYLKKCGRCIPIEYFSKDIRQPGMDSMDIEHFLCVYFDAIDDLYEQYKIINKF